MRSGFLEKYPEPALGPNRTREAQDEIWILGKIS
jgi:hypothetical protein